MRLGIVPTVHGEDRADEDDGHDHLGKEDELIEERHDLGDVVEALEDEESGEREEARSQGTRREDRVDAEHRKDPDEEVQVAHRPREVP